MDSGNTVSVFVNKLVVNSCIQEPCVPTLAGLSPIPEVYNSSMQIHEKKMFSLGGCPPGDSMIGGTSALYKRAEASENL